MKLSLKTAVFTRLLGERLLREQSVVEVTNMAGGITSSLPIWRVESRRGHQYGVWDGRINQNVVVNLHRGSVVADEGLLPILPSKLI